MFEKNPIEQKKQADKLEKETLPRFLKQMLAIRQQSSGSFLVGNDVSRYQKISNINYRGTGYSHFLHFIEVMRFFSMITVNLGRYCIGNIPRYVFT